MYFLSRERANSTSEKEYLLPVDRLDEPHEPYTNHGSNPSLEVTYSPVTIDLPNEVAFSYADSSVDEFAWENRNSRQVSLFHVYYFQLHC